MVRGPALGRDPAEEETSAERTGEQSMDQQPHTGTDPYRHETAGEKLDRNWNELLQELRVMQTGTQIVTAFLVTLPFQARFDEIAGDLVGWYVALLVVAVLVTVLMMLPVAVHRRFFGRQVKERTVALGNLLVKLSLGGLGIVLCGCVAFIAHALLEPGPAWWIAGVTTVVIAVLMGVLPPLLRPGQPHPDPDRGT